MTAPLREMHGIVGQFRGVRALGGVDLDVRAGEVHRLLGQNQTGEVVLPAGCSGTARCSCSTSRPAFES
jgi:ABC-type sugar transport system ATPase subunit